MTNAIAARITQAYQGLTDQSLDADPYSPTISDDEISHPGHTAIGSLGDGHLSRSESYHNAIGQGGTRASDNPFSAASTHVDQQIRSSTLGSAEQTDLARRNEASGHSTDSADTISLPTVHSDAAREETSTVQSRKPKQTSTSANPFSSTPANSGATTDEQTRLGRRFKEGGTSTHVQKLEEQRRKPRVISANMNL